MELKFRFRLFSLLFSRILIYSTSFFFRSSCNCRAQPNAMHRSRRLSSRLCFGRIFYFIPARLKARKFKFHFISRSHSRGFTQLKCACVCAFPFPHRPALTERTENTTTQP